MLRAIYQGFGAYAVAMTLMAIIPPLHAQEKAKADSHGDALPQGALARLGTLRWRHGDTVSFVAFPDAKTVLTASQDNILRLWDRDTGKELRRFGAQQPAPVGQPIAPGMAWVGNVRGSSRVAVSPDGKVLASLAVNNVIHLWEVTSGKELKQIKAPPTGVAAVLFTPDSKTLAVRGTNRTIHLIDPQTGNEIRQLQIAPKQMGGVNGVFVVGFQGLGDASAFAFSPDGKTVAVSESIFDNRKVNYTVKLVSVEKGDLIRTIDVANQGATAIAYTSDGKTLAYASLNSIRLVDPVTTKEIRAINTPMGASMLVFSPDGKMLAAKGRDQATRLFDTESAKEVAQLGEAPVAGNVNQFVFANVTGMTDLRDIAFAPDGKVVAFGAGNVLRFWEVGAGKELPMAGGHRGPVSALAISADGKTIVSRGADNTIRRWDAATGKELGQFQAPKGTSCAAFSADLRMVAFGQADTTISVYDASSGKEINKLTGHPNGAATLAFSPDGKKLASRGSVEQTIRIFDLAKATEIRQIALQVNAANTAGGVVFINRGFMMMGTAPALAFSPDGQSVAANVSANNTGRMLGGFGGPAPAGPGNSLRIFDVTTGKETRKITLPDQQTVLNLAYSPDGRVLAAENGDETISLWEISAGRLRGQLGTPAPLVGGVMNPGGGMGFNPYAVRQPIGAALALSADGELLASKGADNSIRVWDLSVGKEIGQFKGHQGPVASLAFGPAGKTLVSGSHDTTTLVWDVTSLKRAPRPAAVELQAKELEALWSDLAGDDGVKANKGLLRLAAAPKQAVPFLLGQLQPAVAVDPKKIDRWIADLDSTNFKTRGTAAAELEKLGELAVPALKKVLVSPSSLETRRRVEPMIERLTGGVLTSEQIRMARAIEALERIGTTEARQVLQPLAQGAPGAFLTRQAQSALDALAKRSVASR